MSPSQANAGLSAARPIWPLSLDFPNKRFIAVGKFERNEKDHLSMFLKLRFHVLRCSRNGTFVCAYVNILSFLVLRQAAQCQRLYSTPATDAPVLVFDRSGRSSSPSPSRPPTPTDRGPRQGTSTLGKLKSDRWPCLRHIW